MTNSDQAQRTIPALIRAEGDGALAVAGLPLLVRAVLTARRAGLAPIHVVSDDPERTRAVLGRDRRTTNIPVSDVPPNLEGPIIRFSCQTLVSASLLERLRRSVLHEHRSLRFENEGARVEAITAPCPPPPLTQAFAGEESGGTAGSPSPHERLREWGESAEPPWREEILLPVRDRAEARRAEDALVREIRRRAAPTDGPIARLDRALSTRLSLLLVRTPLRPNHITTIGTTIGLLAAWSLASGGHGSGLLGAVLFWIAVIIDGCDGEVARLKMRESRFGGLYDVVTDNIVHVALFAAIAVGYAPTSGFGRDLLLPLFLGGFFCALAATYFCLLRAPAPGCHETEGSLRQRVLDVLEALMNRDFAYLLLVLAALNQLGAFLWGAAFGTWAYAALLVAARVAR